MAQVQTARFPMTGPSWDEEVVPALRKRLESESRTLAKRMSAVSLSSQEDHFVSIYADPTSASTYTTARDSPFLQSNASASARSRYEQSQPRSSFDRIPAANSHSQNGYTPTPIKKKPPSPGPAPAFPRSRTYSQPYLSDLPNGKTQGPKTNGSTHSNGSSKSPRLPDTRPTRIPQPASRSPPSLSVNTSASNQSIPNGYHQYTTTLTTTPLQDPYNGQAPAYPESSPRTPIAIPRAQPNVNVGLGLLHEPPPFNPSSASSSATPSHYSEHENEAPPRASTESEERPFEHWYRGEVSRNGGVGELRVGRRQEMLEIANYGHTLRALEMERREGGKRRKRADSVTGIGDGGRERGSLYLDDEDAGVIGRVMDEAPLTDLEGSEGHYELAYGVYEDTQEDNDEFDQNQDLSSGKVSPPVSRPSQDTRSTTPTPTTIQQAQQRPNSRNTNPPPSRIPARSRQSSESRGTTPTPTQMVRGTSEPSSTPSASTSNSASPPQTRQRQPSKPSPAGRATLKSRTAASKATRAKTLASKKELEEEAKRRSVAYYPTPGGEGDETMIDAIPEWTQPVPRQGNWDDVVLPVVARKKGLDGHYQKADGNPIPRKIDKTIAPAPGTFGFDHSKYRPWRADGEPESIPMDEFGRPTPQVRSVPLPEDEEPSPNPPHPPSNHDQTRLPPRTAPSPAPFSDYAPMRTGEKTAVAVADLQLGQQQLLEEKDEGGGCCKCIIM